MGMLSRVVFSKEKPRVDMSELNWWLSFNCCNIHKAIQVNGFMPEDIFLNDVNYLRWLKRGWRRSSDCTAGRDRAVI